MSTRETVTIQGPEERQRVATWARNVEVGTVVTFRKKSRSTEQNAKLWSMLGEVSEQVEWYGAKLEAEDWKDMFTASLRHARVVPGIDRGTYVPLGMHTSTLTIDEMSNLIELIYAFGADPERGVIFKNPKEQESGASPAPDVPEVPPASATEPDENPPPSSGFNIPDWLPTVAKMLVAATNTVGDVEANLELLNNQRIACGAIDGNPSQAEKDKAGSIYRVCKEITLGTVKRADGLKIISGHAGIEIGAI